MQGEAVNSFPEKPKPYSFYADFDLFCFEEGY